MRHLRLLFLALPLLTAACGTVVFDADFNSDTVGHAPSPAPRVGRIDVSAGSGVVDVVYAPGPDAPQSKWVRIYRPDTQPRGPETVMNCTLSAGRSIGSYALIATMFVQRASD